MIADGTLAEVPGIGETMFAKIVRLATTGELPEYEQAPTRDAARPGRPLARAGSRAEEDQGAARRAEDREPGRPPQGGRGRQDRRDQGLRREDRGEDPRRDHLHRVGRRPHPPEHRSAAGRADRRGGPRSSRGSDRAEVCGSLRRRKETIGDLDILFTADDPKAVLDWFVAMPGVAQVLAHGPTKASVRLEGGVQCDLRGVEPRAVPVRPALLHRVEGAQHRHAAPGDRAGLEAQRVRPGRPRRADPLQDRRPTSSRRSAWRTSRRSCARTGARSSWRSRGRCPSLSTRGDLTGTFHCHTDWSDGGNTLEEMAQAARDAGLDLPGHRRPLPLGRVCRGAVDRPRPRAVGGDRPR